MLILRRNVLDYQKKQRFNPSIKNNFKRRDLTLSFFFKFKEMKLFLSVFSLIICYSYAFNQVRVKEPIYLYYSSKDYGQLLENFKIGNKVLFRQSCTDLLPPDVPNGIVYFEKVHVNEEKISMHIEFEDTMIVSIVYSMKTNNSHQILKKLGFSEIVVNRLFLTKKWTYSIFRDDVNYSFFGDRKNLIIISRILPS